MAENSTLARPYAQAAFEVAAKSGNFESWSKMLELLAQVVRDERVRPLLSSPKLTDDKRVEMLSTIAGDHLSAEGKNMVNVLAHYGRLTVLPEIAARFEELRAEAEGVLDVEVTSHTPLDAEYQARLSASLKQRLGRDVRLHLDTDESLLGGAIIRAGDLVVDGSVRGRLEKLAGVLAH